MAIRLPLKTVLSSDNSTEVGAGSAAGGIAIPFDLPQDTDNVVVKLRASTVGGAVSALFQTSDDGGTTWYDVARTSIVSDTAGATKAEWLSIPVIGMGIRTTTGSGVIGSVGGNSSSSALTATKSAPASALGHSQVTGLPLLGQRNRIFLILSGDLTASPLLTTEVKCNSQSATA